MAVEQNEISGEFSGPALSGGYKGLDPRVQPGANPGFYAWVLLLGIPALLMFLILTK